MTYILITFQHLVLSHVPSSYECWAHIFVLPHNCIGHKQIYLLHFCCFHYHMHWDSTNYFLVHNFCFFLGKRLLKRLTFIHFSSPFNRHFFLIFFFISSLNLVNTSLLHLAFYVKNFITSSFNLISFSNDSHCLFNLMLIILRSTFCLSNSFFRFLFFFLF